jgi:hypothetical protein
MSTAITGQANKCELCGAIGKRKARVFIVKIDGQSVAACSKCITAKHLTGWSL